MPNLDARAIAEIAKMTEELFIDAGFTGVKLEPSDLPAATVAALEASSAEDDEIPFADPEFAREVGYHRVSTDQGSFGIWFNPYVILDLQGLSLDVLAFGQQDTDDEALPPGWCFIGLDEDTLPRLLAELAKKHCQP